jgi:hypothetical protein
VTTFAEDAIAVGEKSSSSASTPRRGGDMGLKTEDMCGARSLSLSLSGRVLCAFFPAFLAGLRLALWPVSKFSFPNTLRIFYPHFSLRAL